MLFSKIKNNGASNILYIFNLILTLLKMYQFNNEKNNIKIFEACDKNNKY